ncbi:Zn(II)2Cys6 transcription factor [Aspergillus alliaceus]|uniref:Zn(II)2Cys6 transcription factor n=1 Tax=Petromyces alliaceus TaxID=209559 RepID=UPI0012A6AEEF|nr:fungal-specific transcription factor domain-containing protein [Aspergillus alliaceus]KAB8239029.1 fungal-specific transcription factor domain-containing protein [Aspergillus alliaceus]
MPLRSSASSKPIRKHVTTACNPCREGKVKCDGVTPVCRNCRAKGKSCSYRQTSDKRKVPLRVTIHVLAQRINRLSRYIQDQGLQVPQMEESDYLTIKDIFETIELKLDDAPCNDRDKDTEMAAASVSHGGFEDALIPENHSRGDGTFDLQAPLTGAAGAGTVDAQELLPPVGSSELHSAHSRTPEDTSQLHYYGTGMNISSAPALDDSSPNAASALLELADAGLYHSTAPIGRGEESAPHPENNADEEEEDEVTNQLSCRLGKLQVTHDGRLRYFGSTSNFTLLDILVDAAPSCQISSQRATQDMLEDAGLGLKVDESLETHLLQLYFTWHGPCLHAVDEEIFWRSRAQKSNNDGVDSPYYSRTLSDAMCAIGAKYEPKYHPDLVTYPRSLAEFFSDRAKISLESELENPSLTTVQALVILGAYEASCTRDTRGWLYSGMAMRLAFDLGLHLDMAPYVGRGTISCKDYDVRRITFWAVYMSEQFWGYYLGRPTRSPMDGVTVPKPDRDSHLPPMKWKPYGSPYLSMNMANLPNPLGPMCYQWVSLYDYMLPLTNILYGCCEISKHQLQELTSNTVEKLRLWKANLPPELKIHEKPDFPQPLPHVLALHMQYHQLMIHCHRPYISRHHIQPQPPQGPGSSHARMMCMESAIAIAQTLALYERYYSFRRANFQVVSFIFSAALILIFAIVPTRQYEHDRELVAYLSTCFRALDEMGSQFENANRTSTFLNTLQREWQACQRSRMARGVKRKFDIHREPWKDILANQTQSLQGSAASAGFCADMRPGVDSTVEGSLYSVDFMEPDLCNILLSEGIPRAFV